MWGFSGASGGSAQQSDGKAFSSSSFAEDVLLEKQHFCNLCMRSDPALSALA